MTEDLLIETPVDVRPLAPRLVRSAASGFVLTILSNIFIFAGMVLIPRALTREDYAQFTVSISFVALLALVADLGMTPLFTRLFAKAEEDVVSGKPDTRGQLLGSAFALRVVMSGVAAALLFIVGSWLYSASMLVSMSIVLISLVISSRLMVVRAVGESALRGHGRYYLVALFALPDAIAFALLLLLLRNNLSLHEALWIYSLSNLPGFLLVVGALTRWVRSERLVVKVKLSVIAGLLRESIPLMLWTAFLTIHTQIDNLLLDKLSTPFEVSSYAASIRLFSAVLPIPMVLAYVISPELTRLLHRSEHARSKQLMDFAVRVLLVCSGALALLLGGLSSDLVTVLLGQKYAAIAPLLQWMGWMLIPIFIATILVETSVAAGSYWHATMYALCIMVVVTVFDYILIPANGASGALISKAIAVSMGCILFVDLLRTSDFFDVRRFMSAFLRSIVCIAAALAVQWIARSYIPNSIVVTALTVLVFAIALHFTRVLSMHELLDTLRKLRVAGARG